MVKTKFGARDCDVVKSAPGATDKTNYVEVKSWLDHTIGFPVYVEKTMKRGTVKEFTYYGLRQEGGIWSAHQVEAKMRGHAGSNAADHRPRHAEGKPQPEGLQSRATDAFPGRQMNLLFYLLGVAATLIMAGIVYQSLGAYFDRRRYAGEGRRIDIGGRRRLYLVEKGSSDTRP